MGDRILKGRKRNGGVGAAESNFLDKRENVDEAGSKGTRSVCVVKRFGKGGIGTRGRGGFA